MKNKKLALNVVAVVLFVILVVLVLVGRNREVHAAKMDANDGIEQVDLDTIYLKTSKVEVNFSEVLLSKHDEKRQLIVSTQEGTVKIELTDRVIKMLDFGFLKKTQTVSYTGEGYFVVDLSTLKEEDITVDREKCTITIKIDHTYLEAVEIDPDKIIIDTVKQGLLARGDIELTVADYNAIEKEIRDRLKAKFNTPTNAQEADDIALEMVREIYEPIIKAIDADYSVIVKFK